MTADRRSAPEPEPAPDAPPALAVPFDLAWLEAAPISTARLELRPLRVDDSDDIWQYQRLPGVLRYIPWPERTRQEAHAHTVKRVGMQRLETDGDAVHFAMALRGEPTTRGTAGADASAEASPRGGSVGGDLAHAADRDLGADGAGRVDDMAGKRAGRVASRAGDRVIGDVMLRIESVGSARLELGWVLHPDFQGRGYAAEAASAVLRVAFETLHAHRVLAHLDVRNEASARLCERLGMRREAVLIEEEYDDGWQDSAIYGLLRREWAARLG